MARTVSGAERPSGFEKKPDYPISIHPFSGTVRVTAGGREIASSAQALILNEAAYPPVYYLPRADVRMEALRRSDHSTHCPFKGDASYWSVGEGDEAIENAVWSYEDPFLETAEIKDYLAFYPGKVEIEVAG